MTRATGRERPFQDEEMRYFWKLMWDAADFCGLIILTFALMETHPHVDVLVPLRIAMPSDEELLRRYRVLHPHPTKYQAAQLAVIEANLQANTPDSQEWRDRQWVQMGDISMFMKIVKQRFTQWYNRRHNRRGTLWAERFKSVLVEENTDALRPIAAYIDLNPVRAGLVTDPKDYTYSGYAHAVAGHPLARQGIMRITETSTWDEAQASYRLLLYGTGVKARHGKKTISLDDFDQVAAQGGRLSQAEALHCRIRLFSDGGVVGSKDFVQRHLEAHRQRYHRKRRTAPRPLPAITDWGGLTSLRGSRRS